MQSSIYSNYAHCGLPMDTIVIFKKNINGLINGKYQATEFPFISFTLATVVCSILLPLTHFDAEQEKQLNITFHELCSYSPRKRYQKSSAKRNVRLSQLCWNNEQENIAKNMADTAHRLHSATIFSNYSYNIAVSLK